MKRRKTSKRSGLTGEQYKALCRQIVQRDGWRCRNPLCHSRNSLHVHHIIFRSQQGPDETWNLVTVCNTCHDRLHGKAEPKLIIFAFQSNDPNIQPNADMGLCFVTI